MVNKFFLYARKSTEEEERQVMSIEAQLFELEELAKKDGLEIVEKFVEHKSAKQPGREVFNQMVEKIYANKEQIGILAWHPDRLARNSVDGGQIIYLIDLGKIAALRFPTFWFEPTPQGLFMLQVAFGQSKYYSDNLSENVKRGIRQKLRRGEWCSSAPIGYTNNLKTHNIEPDPIKSKIIAKAYEEYSSGNYTLKTFARRLSFWGLTSRSGKLLAKSVIIRMLKNKVYLGIITRNGESYTGSFPSIVPQATFDLVQLVLKQKSHPRHSKQSRNFAFVGLMRCGECSAMITAQLSKNKYRYYRCTKRLKKCSQPYLEETMLTEQLKNQLSKVTLPDSWSDKMLAQIEKWENEEKQNSRLVAQNNEVKVKKTDDKLDTLVNMFLDNTIDKETYLKKKDELIQTKIQLREQKTDFGRLGNNVNELCKKFVQTARQSGILATSNDLTQIKSLVKKIGTNHRLFNKTVSFDFQKPYTFILKYKSLCESRYLRDKLHEHNFKSENHSCSGWQELRESDPRL